jgi:hypothetical protein
MPRTSPPRPREPPNDQLGIATFCTASLADLADGAPADAIPRLEESLELANEPGSLYGVAHVHCAFGVALTELGHLDLATEHLYESVHVRRELDEPSGIAESLDGSCCALARRRKGRGRGTPASAAASVRNAQSSVANNSNRRGSRAARWSAGRQLSSRRAKRAWCGHCAARARIVRDKAH